MTKKCDKYETLFVFSDEKTFENHINECVDCKKEHEKMMKVSELIQEVKPLYFKKKKQTKVRVKVACIGLMALLCGICLEYVNINPEIKDIIAYGTTFTADDLELPTDEYGLIMVD